MMWGNIFVQEDIILFRAQCPKTSVNLPFTACSPQIRNMAVDVCFDDFFHQLIYKKNWISKALYFYILLYYYLALKHFVI